MGGIVTSVIGTVEAQHIVAQCYLCQRGKSCKLYGEPYFGSHAPDFRTTFQSFHQVGDFIGFDICIVIDKENVFAFCCTDANVVTTGKTSVLIAADADNRWV